jgi:hypothetical protein
VYGKGGQLACSTCFRNCEHLVAGMLLPVVDRLSLALLGIETAQRTLSTHNTSQLVTFTRSHMSDTLHFSLNDLAQLHRLSQHLDRILENTGAPHVVMCAGQDRKTVTACVFFLGSYLILQRGVFIDQVTRMFLTIQDELETFKDPHRLIDAHHDELTVHDGWRAVQKARDNGWLDFLSDDIEHEDCIDMEEYLHYDSPANGRLHVVIPSELIAFQRPSDLSTLLLPGSDRHWADAGGKRHFAPAFYAEVLGVDYGVQVVVRCCGEATDPAAFSQRGIAVECLAGGAGAGALLRDIDRFLTLARLAPGPIALHGPGIGLGAREEVLAVALLVQRHGFDGRAALAWLRIAHPPAPPPLLALSLAPLPPPAPYAEVPSGDGVGQG